jgi:hypothetical protein
MVKKIVLLLLGVLMLESQCYSISHQEVFNQNYNLAVIKLKYSNFPGPLSEEMAKVALARQVLEDGPNKKSNESIAGISIGGINKTIVNETIPKHINISSASDGTGASFYYFKGFQANLYSTLVISKLFDFYINKFLKSERRNWLLSKEISKAIQQNPDSIELYIQFYNKLNPIKIIEKANRFYGPQHESVVNMYSTKK